MRNKTVWMQKLTVFLTATLLLPVLSGCTDDAAENQTAYKTIGINAMADGDYAGAIDAFNKALEQAVGVVGSEEVDICYYKADAQYRSGDTDGALSTYDALLAFDNSLAEAYFLRGNLYLDQGDAEKALSDYEAAIERDEKDLELYITICENLTNTGYAEQGNEILKRATEISGSGADEHALRGRAYTLLGQYDEAAEELDTAVVAGSVDAQLYKGQLLTATGDTAGAKECFEAYLSEKGDDAGALNALGCMAMETGDYALALSYFDQALTNAEESGINPQEILRNRILALEYNGQFAEAKAAMEEYASNYELDTDFEKEYTFLQTR